MRLPRVLHRGWPWMVLQVVVVVTGYLSRPGFELILRNDSHLYVKLARQVVVS